MNFFFNFAIVLCIALVKAKHLHIKESYTEKSEAVQFQDLFNYDDNVYTEKDRYARHVELVTESVLEHLLKEINNKYRKSSNDTQNDMPKMMQRLKMKLKRHLNKRKNKKLKKKYSKLNSTKASLNEITTTSP
ncbi:uncharacterized protein LOC135083791 [Ostrinia nubilalis]|uniref:uncharacterized protein LOC135083791 n=1 Tax=Ostrinia nubilalis TaxID=29057 RepID=UPI0030823A94